MIGDIAYLDRAIFNNWSRLDVIVNEQTFSQLMFPIEGLTHPELLEDKKLREKLMTLAVNRVLFYSSEASAAPTFISPDASQAEFILTMIERQIRQLYSSMGLNNEVGEETKSESGVAKAFDFDKLNKLLAGKADNLEYAENKMNEFFGAWIEDDGIECMTDYPENFDVRSLSDEIAIANELALMNISETFTKEIEKIVVKKAMPKAEKQLISKIDKEIEEKVIEDPNIDRFDFDEPGKDKDKEG